MYDIIIGSYLDNGGSRFSVDKLGEFEIIDYLMPYEYCGMPDFITIRYMGTPPLRYWKKKRKGIIC